MTARDKDRILAELKEYKSHHKIGGLKKLLPELETEGYVKVWKSEQHNPTMVRLTNKGNVFLEITEG